MVDNDFGMILTAKNLLKAWKSLNSDDFGDFHVFFFENEYMKTIEVHSGSAHGPQSRMGWWSKTPNLSPKILKKGQNRRQMATYFFDPAAPGQIHTLLPHLPHFTSFYNIEVRRPWFQFSWLLPVYHKTTMLTRTYGSEERSWLVISFQEQKTCS